MSLLSLKNSSSSSTYPYTPPCILSRIIHPLPHLEYSSPLYPIMKIAKEELGEHILRNAGGNIPPAARGDAEWRGAAWSLPCQWISGRCSRAQCLWGGRVRYRSALMGYAWLSPCYVVPPAKKTEKENHERGCEGKSILTKSSLSGWRGYQAREGT